MREIKFRVWDKDRKVMANVSNIDFLTGQVQMNGDGNMHSERVSGDKVILLQYTGLKDKKGVEIYEGDIVRVRQPHTSVTLVNFGESISEVSWINENVRVVKWRGCNNPGWDGVLIWGEGKLEVIGNIYENPELLESEAE